MMKKQFLLLFVALLMATLSSWAMVLNVPGTYPTIQAAVAASADGDQILIANGTYYLTAPLYLNHELTITGASEAGVIIDATGTPANSWGIIPNKSNTILSNFTILPNGTNGGYPIHVGAGLVVISNVTLSHITIDGAKKTAFDFNGVDNLTLSYLTATNTVSGNGIQVSGCKTVNASHITTSGNSWGGFAVYVGKVPPGGVGRGSDGVIIDGLTSTFGESNMVYNQDEAGFVNTNITVTGFDYLVQNSTSAAGYTFYKIDKTTALATATALTSPLSSIVKQISTGQFVVAPGLSIQAAINAATAGGVVNVNSGTYSENLTINKNITLISTSGAGTTIIDGNNAGSELGTIQLSTGRNGVAIGSTGHGFTIKGINGTPGLEKAAIYLQGAQNNITIEGNIVEARGDAGLMGEYNAVNTNIIINANEFSGQTFIGANPAGVGFGAQNTLANVPRQLVVFGGGPSTTNTQNFTFTNNVISGISGGMSITADNGSAISPTQQGNTMVTLDLVGTNTITGNTFSGTTTRYAEALRVRGTGAYTITDNKFTGSYPFFMTRVGTTLTATCNWYGTADVSVIAPKIVGPVTYIPYSISAGGACIGGLHTVTVGTLTASACGTLAVPVTVGAFTNVANVSLTLNYDPTVLAYQSVDNINPLLTGNFVNGTIPGQFIFGRSSISGEVTLADNTVLFTLHFNILPAAAVGGITTNLSWSTLPQDCQLTGGGVDPIIYESAFVDGSVTIPARPIPSEFGGPVASASTVECESAALAPTSLPVVKDFCTNVLNPGEPIKQISFTNKFDAAVVLGAAPATNTWYTDRYNPAEFTSPVSFDGDNRLKESINAGDYQTAGFYKTQGRSYDVGTTTNEMQIKLFVPLAWQTSNSRLAGFWGVAANASNAVSGYPIVEFTSDGNNPRFRVWESNGTNNWVNLGLPAGFVYNSWVTLKIRLLSSGEFLLSAGSLNYVTHTSAIDASKRLKSVILQGYNAPSNYDIYWDDFTWNDAYSAIACKGAITYTYNYTDYAGLPFAWTYTYTIQHTTAPAQVGGPVASSSTVYSIDDATVPTSAMLPVVNDICGNVLTPTTFSPGPVDNITVCTGTRTYTYHYFDCANLEYVWTYTYTISTSTLSGTLKYNNAAKTPMNEVTIGLFNSSNVSMGTYFTANGGQFSFPNLCAGEYTIKVTGTNNLAGGVNATDAGAANAWGVTTGTAPIQHVKFLAGDVTFDKQIDAFDALAIMNYFVNRTPFASTTPIWSYWKKVSGGELISDNEHPYDNYTGSPNPWPTDIKVTVHGDVPNLELYGMFTGDFNGDRLGTTLKSASSALTLTQNNTVQIGANQAFELPMVAASAMQVGAVSMILQIPSNLVNVQDILVNGSADAAVWAVNGNELRIGWYSLNPVNVAENGKLITLKLKTTNAFTTGQTVDIDLKFDPLNELADGNFDVIEDASLLVAQVGNGVGVTGIINPGDAQGLLFSNYPNPFKGLTTVDYKLPVQGKVNITVYNQLGQTVQTLIDANQNAGNYSIRMDANNLMPGIYIAKLRLTNTNVDMTGTVKLSVLK